MATACYFLRVPGLPSITTFKDPDTQALDLLQASAAARHSVSWRLKLVGHSAMRRQSGYTGESMIVPALIGGGAAVRVVDPQGRNEGEALLLRAAWHEDSYAAAQGADLLVILTEWNEFRALDLARLAGGIATPRMADLRNIYSTHEAKRAGFETYVSVGR